MQDACKARANAVKSILPNIDIYMCWYHVLANVKKEKKKFRKANRHFSKNEIEFNSLKESAPKR